MNTARQQGNEPPLIRAVLFDLDGTLHDRATSLQHFAEDQHQRLQLASYVARDAWVNHFVELDAEGLVWKDKVYQQLTAEITIPWSWQQLLADYEANFPSSARLYPDASTTLVALRKLGLTLGLVTNGRTAFQRAVIEALDIAPLFDTVLISEAEGTRKPEAEIFIRALTRLGATRKEAIFVGDSPSADISGARNAGIYAVWKRNKPNLTAPIDSDHIIEDLREIVTLPVLNAH